MNDGTRDASTSTKEMVTAAGRAVKEEMSGLADYAGRKALDQIETQKQSAVETLGEFANAIRHAGDELAQHDRTLAGRMVTQAANGLEQFSRSVADKRPEEMLDAVRDFGRRNPLAFVAGSVLAGVAIARFLRSSNSHGSRSSDHQARPSDHMRGTDNIARPDQVQEFSSVRSGGVVEQPPIGPGN